MNIHGHYDDCCCNGCIYDARATLLVRLIFGLPVLVIGCFFLIGAIAQSAWPLAVILAVVVVMCFRLIALGRIGARR